MSLENFRDISRQGSDTSAGFQFEFYCEQCSRKWKSPFKPYRRGQLAGLLMRLGYFFGDRGSMGRTSGQIATMGSDGAREKALQEAQDQAQTLYTRCPKCEQAVCEDDWNPRNKSCARCAGAGNAAAASGSASGNAAAPSGAMSCPNCQTAFAGGRFCAECGFDMASTHKSCPGCGTMCLRQARFCTDCGHSF